MEGQLQNGQKWWGTWGFPRAMIWSEKSDGNGFAERTNFLLNRVQFELWLILDIGGNDTLEN